VIGEYIRKGQTVQFAFAVAPGESPQRTVVLRTRACPKSPVIELTLVYETTDTRRDVALYRIEKEVPVEPPPARSY
jgi:hypothetical protein